MCRNIKMLFNFDPPVTPEEVRAASLQFVRKISGFNKPSKANEEAFQSAIDAIAGVSTQLLCSLQTNAPAKNREEEAARLKARSAKRFPLKAYFASSSSNMKCIKSFSGASFLSACERSRAPPSY